MVSLGNFTVTKRKAYRAGAPANEFVIDCFGFTSASLCIKSSRNLRFIFMRIPPSWE
jgi:hypothetical protein